MTIPLPPTTHSLPPALPSLSAHRAAAPPERPPPQAIAPPTPTPPTPPLGQYPPGQPPPPPQELARENIQTPAQAFPSLFPYHVNLIVNHDAGVVVAQFRNPQDGSLIYSLPPDARVRQAALLREALGQLYDRGA